MEIYKKIRKAIDLIGDEKIKKEGRNTFSNYDYFTPEQVDFLVKKACGELNLLVKFDLIRSELGLEGVLSIYDLDDFASIVYRMATDIPLIKATNVTQQIGGTMTYTKRYMLMNVFEITDNNLDFDTEVGDNQAKKEEIVWLTNVQFESAMKSDVKGISATLSKFDTPSKKMKKDFKIKLEGQLNALIN